MNATPIVSQNPIASDPTQINDSTPGGSLNSQGSGHDFAATLSSVGGKPARRSAGSKAHDGAETGGSLPSPGNLPPPPAVAAVGSTAAAAGTAAGGVPASMAATATVPADASGSAKAAVGATSAAATAVGAAAHGGPFATSATADGKGDATHGGAPDATAIPGPQGQLATESASTADPGTDFAEAMGLTAATAAGSAQAAADAAKTDGAAAAKNAKETPGVAAVRVPGSAGIAAPLKARSGSAAGTVSGSAARAVQETNTDANAATSLNGGSATDGDAAAQTATAAVASAVTNAVGAPGGADDPTVSSADGSAIPAAGNAARPAGRPGGLPVPLPPDAPPAAATAAKAAAGAEAGTVLAAAGASSDRHTHAGSTDSLTSTDSNGPAGVAPLGINAATSTDAAPTPTLKVTAGVDTPDFGQGLADRVSWMVGNNLNGAKLQVNPSQLGPIEVRIAVQGGHAQVWLTSHSAVTRDALESSSQKLRDMLGAQGFGQVSVDISQRSFQERSPQAQPYDWTPSPDRGASRAAVSPAAARSAHPSSSAVDAYA
jgi:flagellar hook-length control protein FliK